MNKTISFCLYGDDPKYVVGAYKNAQIASEIMPDWTVTIYTNDKVTSYETIKKLKTYRNVSVVDPDSFGLGEKLFNARMFWRYLSFFNNTPCIARDLDSRLTSREKTYIDNWIDSDSNFFIIRDHPWHSQVPGGLIGMRNIGNVFEEFFIKFISENDTGWGKDQEMLNSFVYNYYISPNIYRCEYNSSNYIPRDNKSFFIGIQLDENDNPLCQKSLAFLNDLNL